MSEEVCVLSLQRSFYGIREFLFPKRSEGVDEKQSPLPRVHRKGGLPGARQLGRHPVSELMALFNWEFDLIKISKRKRRC